MGEGVGIRACLEALRPKWRAARAEAERFNAEQINAETKGPLRPWRRRSRNVVRLPATLRCPIRPPSASALNAMGESPCIRAQSISAKARIRSSRKFAPMPSAHLSIASIRLRRHRPFADCGKTSASRQTFVTGRAAYMAGRELRDQIFRLTNADAGAAIQFGEGHLIIMEYRFHASSPYKTCRSTPTATS